MMIVPPLTQTKFNSSIITFTLCSLYQMKCQQLNQTYSPVLPHTLRDIHFSDSDVLDLLTNLDVSKASGIDNFSPKIFKYCALPYITSSDLSSLPYKLNMQHHTSRLAHSLCNRKQRKICIFH